MRFALCVLALSSLAWGAAPAVADEPSAPPADPAPVDPAPVYEPKPDPAKALFISESLMPGEDDEIEGWKPDDAADTSALDEALNALGEELGLGQAVFYVQMLAFEKDGTSVPVAMVDVDEKVYAYRHALSIKAKAEGWTVASLGHPGRILVLSGPPALAKDLHAKLREHTVYTLSEMASNRISGYAGQQEAGREAALTYAGYIDSLAPRSGTANAVRGAVHWVQARHKLAPKEKPRREEDEKAVAFWKKALADGVPFPPRKGLRVFAAGEMGGIILTRKDPSKLDEATRALEIAVEHEKDGKRMSRRHGNRYNLACAYARAKRIDDAFEMLKKSLEVLKTMPAGVWRAQHKHASEKDEDMRPLRGDPRFKKLMEEFKPPAPKKHPVPKPKSEKEEGEGEDEGEE